MTPPEVIQAYRDKYKAFPDLVERIVSQFDYEWWESYNSTHDVDIDNFADWKNTIERVGFWEYLSEYEEDEELTRESIDAAYAEFGIEPLTPEIDMSWLTAKGYYWPLFIHMSNCHGVDLLNSEMDDIIHIVKGMETVKTSELLNQRKHESKS